MARAFISTVYVCSLVAFTSTCLLFSSAGAWEKPFAYGPLGPETKTVSQNLLKLVHTPEVQKELGVDEELEIAFEMLLRSIDKSWWPSRILPADKQRAKIAELENRLIQTVEQSLGTESVLRLRQIEIQSQGVRALVRPEVSSYLKINEKERQELESLFAATDKLESELQAAQGNVSNLAKELQESKKKETTRAVELLKPKQKELFQKIAGKPFETSQLTRIYPLAPELIDSEDRFGTGPRRLADLKGKVVIVHFYAFQCHNCVANFGHYKRWDEKLKERGVQVIGIQTPETREEADPEKVIQAAKRESFQFPVIVDLKKKNWDAWGNTMWPTVYVIDKKGYIRFWWQGELNWQGATVDKKIEEIVDRLLIEP